MLNDLHTVFYLILKQGLRINILHFADEETQAQIDGTGCPPRSPRQKQNSNSGSPDPSAEFSASVINISLSVLLPHLLTPKKILYTLL